MDYEFGRKEAYRRQLWNKIDEFIGKKKSIRERRVLYIDTAKGLETEVLLRKGYLAENLFPTNNNPAIAATLTKKMKQRFKNWKTFGKDAFDLCLDQPFLESLDAINFDICSPVHSKLFVKLRKIAKTPKEESVVYLPKLPIIALTLLRGREMEVELTSTINRMRAMEKVFRSSKGRSFAEDPKKIASHYSKVPDRIRLGSIIESFYGPIEDECIWHLTQIHRAKYMSTSGQSFLWCVMKFEHHYLERYEVDLDGEITFRLPNCLKIKTRARMQELDLENEITINAP